MLDLHRLTLLREVSLRGSMSAAARELSYSHSAISQQLALLEKEVGVALLERVGRNVRLTPTGKELVRNTELILSAVERAESDLATAHQRPEGVITVVAFPTISRAIMPQVLVRLAATHPRLDVRLNLMDLPHAAVALVSRQVDVVIADSYPGTRFPVAPGTHVSTLSVDPIQAYLPEPSIEDDIEALRGLPWATEPLDTPAAQWAMGVCRQHGFEPFIAHTSTDLLFHLRMVEQGRAAAFLPDLLIRETGSSLRPSTQLTVTIAAPCCSSCAKARRTDRLSVSYGIPSSTPLRDDL